MSTLFVDELAVMLGVTPDTIRTRLYKDPQGEEKSVGRLPLRLLKLKDNLVEWTFMNSRLEAREQDVTFRLLQSEVDFLREKLSQTTQQLQSERERADKLHRELLAFQPQPTPVIGMAEQRHRLLRERQQEERSDRLQEALQQGEVHKLMLPPLKSRPLERMQRSARRVRRQVCDAPRRWKP